MSENVVAVIGFTLVAVVLMSPVGCTMYESALIERMVRAGADPIDARCAINAGNSARSAPFVLPVRGVR